MMNTEDDDKYDVHPEVLAVYLHLPRSWTFIVCFTIAFFVGALCGALIF